MKLNTKFDLKQKVKILELEKIGIIKSIYLTNLGISYNVRYFNNETATETYFYDDELEEFIEKEKALGFQSKSVNI